MNGRLGLVFGFLVTLIPFVISLHVRQSETPAEAQLQSISDLALRLLPAHAHLFVFSVVPSPGYDSFTVSTNGSHVLIYGNNGVAMASGLHWYLKHACNASISWSGDNLVLPDPLPLLSQPHTGEFSVGYRYYLNPVTFGYTTVWWNWTQWERELDWMALHGINLFLAHTGQEKITQNVFKKFNLEIPSDFFTGPAFLPWNRMGNVNGWQGVLPQSWIDAQAELQKKILQRARSLGMMAILPGFSGHAPSSIMWARQGVKMQMMPEWHGFQDGTWQLHPLDPLFSELGRAFIEETISLYGTDHFYGLDPFNEENPSRADITSMGKIGATIYRSIASGDPEAVWVLNGWMFTSDSRVWDGPTGQSFLMAIPQDKILIIDAWAELLPKWRSTESFYSHPFIWSILHNFGGRPGLFGSLWKINYKPFEGLTNSPWMVGMGMQPEGLGTNPIIYELMSENSLRTEPRSEKDLNEWVAAFAKRRYGTDQECAARAWRLLQFSVYNSSSLQKGACSSIIASRPGTRVMFGYTPIIPYYSVASLISAAKELISCVDAEPHLRDSRTMQADVFEIVRQILSDKAYLAYVFSRDAIFKRVPDREALNHLSSEFLQILELVESLAATQEDQLLGKWIEDARRWGTTDEERNLMETNAKRLVTIWGPKDNTRLHDYAFRLWSGLIKDFYIPRWKLYFQIVNESLDHDQWPDEGEITQLSIDFEEDWVSQNTSYPTKPSGSFWDVVQDIAQKYLH